MEAELDSPGMFVFPLSLLHHPHPPTHTQQEIKAAAGLVTRLMAVDVAKQLADCQVGKRIHKMCVVCRGVCV